MLMINENCYSVHIGDTDYFTKDGIIEVDSSIVEVLKSHGFVEYWSSVPEETKEIFEFKKTGDVEEIAKEVSKAISKGRKKNG